nr:hypothetical protein [Bacteroidota bacterium]
MKQLRLIWIIMCAWIFSGSPAFTQNIPDNRLVDWSVAGLENVFIYPDTVINVVDFGAAGDGINNDAGAIQNAINFFSGNAGIVLFPPGIYLLNSGISLNDSVVLKGSGSDSTTLRFNLNGVASNCINISGSTGGGFQPVLSNSQKSSEYIIVGDVSDFNTGDYAEIREENGNWDTNPVSWADYSVGQMVRIIRISDDTLFLRSPLRIDFSETLNPEIRKTIPRKYVTVESLKVQRMDEPAEGAGSNFNFSYAINCRIAGVESDHSVGAHINMHNSSNIEVSGCYVHDAFTYDGTGTRGYGVCMSMHTGECLIVNNIFKHLRHAMMVKTGSNGNVFSYNYSLEPYRSEPINDFSGDISLHGHFAFTNLFEGNIVQNIIIDHYWGPSGPYNTFLRNRAEWYGLIMTQDNGVSSDFQNFIGNEITENGYNFLIQLWYGLYYALKGSDHFEWGNNSGGEIIPSGTAEMGTTSLYLEYKPEFWDEEEAWLTIGWPIALNTGSIPAEVRFDSGAKLTVDPIPQIQQQITLIAGWSGISSFTDPYPGQLEFLFAPVLDNLEILYNFDGMFIPAQSVNTLNRWNYEKGYIVKMDQPMELLFLGGDI